MLLVKFFIVSGTFLSGLGVMLGAFGAHYLKTKLSQEMLTVFEVGVRYQIYHGLALCLLGVFSLLLPNRFAFYSGLSFLLGIILFSGSLYLLAGSGSRFFGAVTPIGGLFLILGWGLFLLAGMRLS